MCGSWSLFLVAVVSAVVGALLVGAANLWLAQRTERRAARAGAHQLEDDLRSAADLIDAHLPHGYWWDALSAPSTAAWELHQQALVAQLPSKQITPLQDAVQKVRLINLRAGLRYQAYSDAAAVYQKRLDAEIWSRAQRGVPDPEKSVKQDKEFQRELHRIEPSLAFDDEDRSVLEAARGSIRDAVKLLEGPDTEAQLSERQLWWPRSKRARGWAFVVVVTLVAAVLGLSWLVAPEGKVSAGAVASAVATQLNGESSVECDALPGQTESAWRCVAAYAWGKCPASASAARLVTVVEAAFVSQQKEQPPPGCGGLEGWDVTRLSAQLAANADLVMASGGRLEADDPHPSQNGTNLRSGMVPTPVDDPSDTYRLALPKSEKRAWWMFWR